MKNVKQSICVSFKKELLQGIHDVFNHDFYIILLNNNEQKLNEYIESYYDITTEVETKDGYFKGGKKLNNPQIIQDENIIILTFDNIEWNDISLFVDSAFIYNNSLENKNAVAIINFNEKYQTDFGDFIIEFPEANKENGFIRII